VPELSHLIQYRCIVREHERQRTKEPIFVHQSHWAYCAAGRDVSGHKFLPTGGLDRRGLESRRDSSRKG
jgi:hypothetical protein